jgi:hypothetical protein
MITLVVDIEGLNETIAESPREAACCPSECSNAPETCDASPSSYYAGVAAQSSSDERVVRDEVARIRERS